jgi:hypothetical protein
MIKLDHGHKALFEEQIYCDSDQEPKCKDWVNVKDCTIPYQDKYLYKDKNGHLLNANYIKLNFIKYI